jgi:hypothetical protein
VAPIKRLEIYWAARHLGARILRDERAASGLRQRDSDCRLLSSIVLILPLVFLCVEPNSGEAEQRQSAPLLQATDIQAAAAPQVFQGVTGDASGAVHYPDQALAFPLARTAENSQLLDAWHKSHNFFVVPIDIAIAPTPGLIPERVDISLAFPSLGQLNRQPLVIDTFPKTGFALAPFSGKAEVKVGADLKFVAAAPVTPTAGANASLSYSYAPAYANVIAGYGSGSAFWQFMRTQDKYPVGDIPMKVIVAVPKSAATQALTLSVDTRVEYPGGWLSRRGLSIASFRMRVAMPPAP